MDIKEQWIAAVKAGDVDRVSQLLGDHPQLVETINDPVFPFESPAAFQCRENLPLLDLLLAHGADLNQKTGWWAGGFGILEGIEPAVAQPLIDRGARIDIWSAVGLDRVDEVIRLLNQNPDLITARGGDGKHPLHYARNVAMVDLLVDHGADVNARDIDHTSSAAQYLIHREPVVRRLLEKGAQADIFMAAALGDVKLAESVLANDPAAADSRLGCPPWTNQAGGDIYNWTLGHDMTPQDVARQRGHTDVLDYLLQACSPGRRLMDAIWNGDRQRVDEIIRTDPAVRGQLTDDDYQMLPRAAWWYRPEAVRIMLQLDFDPHIPGAHDSTPLDRAAFHGYADIVETLLDHDLQPPIDRQNEFGGTPLDTCLHGLREGWETGHPRDHARTIRLLIDAGAQADPKYDRTGIEAIDRELFRDPSL